MDEFDAMKAQKEAIEKKQWAKCGHPEMSCQKAHAFHVQGLLERDKEIDTLRAQLKEQAEQLEALKEALEKMHVVHPRMSECMPSSCNACIKEKALDALSKRRDSINRGKAS